MARINIAVFGATGGTGRQIVKQALAAGHQVTAVVRTPSAFEMRHEHLEVQRGDVMNPTSLASSLSNQGAVLSALGVGSSLQPTTLYSTGTRHVLQTMKAVGVRRFIGVSAGGFVTDPNDSFLLKRVVKPILKRILKNPYDDMKRMEADVERSDLDWTIIRPARLNDGPHTGQYRIALNGNVPGGWTISRADVADFMVKHLSDRELIGTAVGIAY